MTDLIKRADAIEVLQQFAEDEKPNDEMSKQFQQYQFGRHLAFLQSVDEIKALPSAEATQGEWKQTITWQPYCSNCEYVFGEDEEFSPFWKYCPMCGARMENTK